MNEKLASAPETLRLTPEIAEYTLRDVTLYHGSSVEGVTNFEVGEEGTTLGDGVYFVDNTEDATGYARRRSRSFSGVATLYEAHVADARLVDLDDEVTRTVIFEGYYRDLSASLQLIDKNNWIKVGRIGQAMKAIREGRPTQGDMRSAVFNCSDLFTQYIKDLGYDGVKAWEGGEGNDVGAHETYLLFDPQKADITQSHAL